MTGLIDGALHQLMSTQLVVVGGVVRDALVFRHALIQDTAYQSLLSRRRRHYHEAIAKVLIDAYPDLVVTQPELIAQHYVKAQQNELALPYWMKAGERALGRSANYEAVDHFQNALAIAEHLPEGPARQKEVLEATLKLSEALREAGRVVGLRGKIQADRAIGSRSRRYAGLHPLCARFRCRPIPFREADRRIARTFSRKQWARSTPTIRGSRCQLLSRLARAYMYLGDSKNSAKCHKEGVYLARRLGDKASLFELSVLPFLTPTTVTIRRGGKRSDCSHRRTEAALQTSINDDELLRGPSPYHSTFTSRPNWAIAREPIERSTGWRNLGRCASVSTSCGWLAMRGP